MRYIDPTEQPYWCPVKDNFRTLLGCLKCLRYPCTGISEAHKAMLAASPFVRLDQQLSKLLPRKTRMYIFRMLTGELQEAPVDFNPDQPDFTELQDVEEVLVISKVLVKQLRLVAKPKEERAAIREQLSSEEPSLAEEDTVENSIVDEPTMAMQQRKSRPRKV